MRNRLRMPQNMRKWAFVLTVFALFLMYMVWQVNFYLFNNIKNTYYMAVVPILVAGVLYFRRLKNGPEYTLLLLYWVWYIITRIINGDPALVREYTVVLDMSLMLPFFLVGLALDRRSRKRFLDWFSAALGGYYFILGVFCLAAFVLRTQFTNPITGGLLGLTTQDKFERINILDINVCSTAYWFMMAFLVMVYQFFACKNKLWRIPIVLAGLVHFSVLAITYTRSAKLALAVGIGGLAMLLLYNCVKIQKKALLALSLAAAFIIAAPLAYKSFDLVTLALGELSDTVRQNQAEEQTDPAQETLETESDTLPAYQDPRGWSGDLNEFSSGRIEIYEGAFTTIVRNPSVLLRGSLLRDAMTITNENVKTPYPHYHNFLIQALIVTGLPGLLLVLAISILVVIKAIKLALSRDEKAELSVKMLALPLAASFVYGMFEVSPFVSMDARSIYFYIICGSMLGFYYDIFPRKGSITQAN